MASTFIVISTCLHLLASKLLSNYNKLDTFCSAIYMYWQPMNLVYSFFSCGGWANGVQCIRGFFFSYCLLIKYTNSDLIPRKQHSMETISHLPSGIFFSLTDCRSVWKENTQVLFLLHAFNITITCHYSGDSLSVIGISTVRFQSVNYKMYLSIEQL